MNKIDKNMPSRKYLDLIEDLPRRQSSIIIQLRTGFAPLNGYLHSIKAKDSPDCPQCVGRWETTFHFLVECPTYARCRHDKLIKKHAHRFRCSSTQQRRKTSRKPRRSAQYATFIIEIVSSVIRTKKNQNGHYESPSARGHALSGEQNQTRCIECPEDWTSPPS
jgi:hypothetical protein